MPVRTIIRMGHPTVHWIVETVRMTKWIQRHTDRLSVPILVLKASEDAYVNGRGIDRFCKGVADCRKVEFTGSWHEMLIETDDIRDQLQPVYGLQPDGLGAGWGVDSTEGRCGHGDGFVAADSRGRR